MSTSNDRLFALTEQFTRAVENACTARAGQVRTSLPPLAVQIARCIEPCARIRRGGGSSHFRTASTVVPVQEDGES